MHVHDYTIKLSGMKRDLLHSPRDSIKTNAARCIVFEQMGTKIPRCVSTRFFDTRNRRERAAPVGFWGVALHFFCHVREMGRLRRHYRLGIRREFLRMLALFSGLRPILLSDAAAGRLFADN